VVAMDRDAVDSRRCARVRRVTSDRDCGRRRGGASAMRAAVGACVTTFGGLDYAY